MARWLSVARARLCGRALPPVALVQVGDVYFVRDEHHCISATRALGQTVLEATVEVRQVDGPLPWDARTGTPRWVKRLLRGLLGHLRPRTCSIFTGSGHLTG
jgi:hypothetical protein